MDEEQFREDMARVRQYRQAHFEVQVSKGRLGSETIEVMVTHNGSQWHAIEMDTKEEAEKVVNAILEFLETETFDV